MHKLNLWRTIVNVMHKQQLNVPQIAMLVKISFRIESACHTLVIPLKPVVLFRALTEEEETCGNGQRIKTVWSCSPWTCRLQPTSLKWEKTPHDVTGRFSKDDNSLGWCFSNDVKCLLMNLALAGSPRWTECNFVPVVAAPRSSELPRCSSTSQATSHTPRTRVSKHPC